jgi:hypothetical protein
MRCRPARGAARTEGYVYDGPAQMSSCMMFECGVSAVSAPKVTLALYGCGSWPWARAFARRVARRSLPVGIATADAARTRLERTERATMTSDRETMDVRGPRASSTLPFDTPSVRDLYADRGAVEGSC